MEIQELIYQKQLNPDNVSDWTPEEKQEFLEWLFEEEESELAQSVMSDPDFDLMAL